MFAVLTRVRGGKTHAVKVMKNRSWNSNFGVLEYNELLAKGPGAMVNAVKPVKGGSGERYVWRWASLEDYVTLHARRAATPIYSKDAWTLGGLLDAGPGKRILEAGSGIGALTLALSRGGADVVSVENRVEAMKCAQGNVSRWWAHEAALRGSLEGEAEEAVSRPPSGYGRVQWVLGELGRVLELHEAHFGAEVEKYDGAVLDVMTPWKVLDATVAVVKPGGVIAVYAPNITQVTETVSGARGVFVERVIEVGHREWDVKAVPGDSEAMIAHPSFSQSVSHTGFLLLLRVKRTRKNWSKIIGADGDGEAELQ